MKSIFLYSCIAVTALSLSLVPLKAQITPAPEAAAPAAGLTADAAAPAVHQFPMLGGWKLNLVKSNFGEGAMLRDMVVKVTSANTELIVFTTTATYESGMEGTYSFKGPADGKDHPLTGSASTYCYSEENGVLTETQKDADGTVTKGTWFISANGKEGTWTYTVTNPDASIVHQKLVFTKQAL